MTKSQKRWPNKYAIIGPETYGEDGDFGEFPDFAELQTSDRSEKPGAATVS